MEKNHSNYVVQDKVINQGSIYSKVFLWMFMGLFATGLISWVSYSTGFIENILTPDSFTVLMIVELLVVVIFSLLFRKLPPTAVTILFFVYAAINGVTIASIYYVYEISSIIYTVFAAALIFGVFAFLGSKTSIDLSKISTILFVGLLASIIISIVNLFLGSEFIDYIVSWVVLILFFGITAYDMQRIKQLALSGSISSDKIHVYGAMLLYLDFINIFLRILRLFGKRR